MDSELRQSDRSSINLRTYQNVTSCISVIERLQTMFFYYNVICLHLSSFSSQALFYVAVTRLEVESLRGKTLPCPFALIDVLKPLPTPARLELGAFTYIPEYLVLI